MKKIALICGSVYGAAEQVASEAASMLRTLGYDSRLFTDAKLDDVLAYLPDIWLVVTSSTGQGDIPDNLFPFYLDVQNRFPLLTGKQFAVIALGDSSYEHFCGAGERFRELLLEIQGTEHTAMLRIDACETLEPETIALPWLKQHFG